MKKMKKFFAVILSLAMVLGMSVTGFAASGTSKTQATIKGITAETGITVKAYKIIQYNEAGSYTEVLANSITKTPDGKLNPTAADLKALAKKTGELELKEITTKDDDGNYVTSDLTAGTWMIIVEGSKDYIYNPAIISVMQTDEGLAYGTLDFANDKWTNGGEVYLKKSEPTITKEATTPNVKGVQYGDVIDFKITANIPSYVNKDTIEYTISDRMTGLALVNEKDADVTITVDGKTDAKLTKLAKDAIVNGQSSFTIKVGDLGTGFFKTHADQEIVLTYKAKVTSAAEINVDKSTNSATLTYTTNNGTSSKTSGTKHYTFGIDTGFTGAEGTKGTTGEFIKVDENGNVKYTETPGEVTVTGGKALKGAEFQLHVGSATGKLFTDAKGNSTFITDDNGRLQINGLDPDVTYYLVETKAPTGYKVVDTPIAVKINASFDDNGNLTGYTVTINGNTTNYNYSEKDGTTTLVNPKDTPSNPFGFNNTKLSALPSTGGIGTTIFTIAGCAIMVAAAFFFFTSRKKANK